MKKKKKKPRASDPLPPVVTGVKEGIVLPDYRKPWQTFSKQVKVGDQVKVWKRILIDSLLKYELHPVEGTVIEKREHAFMMIIHGELGPKKVTYPWWSIHDWEIKTRDETDDSSGSPL